MKTETKKILLVQNETPVQKEIKHRLTKSGFKLKEWIDDKEDRKAFCPVCKKNQKIKNAYISKHKNGILFLRGVCKKCKAESWKSIKEKS